MANPRIVGASKVVGTKVATSSTPSLERNVERTRTLRNNESRARGYQGRRIDTVTDVLPDERPTILPQRKVRTIRTNAASSEEKILLKRANALRASATMLWIPFAFWCLQFGVWAFGMVGLGIEDMPGVNLLYPGITLFQFSYYFIAILGVLTLIYMAAIYVAQQIDCIRGMKLFAFAISFSLYLFPFINAFPCFLLWMCAVIYLQNED